MTMKLASKLTYQDQLQETVRPFWQMLEQQKLEPDQWNEAMGKVMSRAVAVYQAGLSVESPEVQSVVDDWIHVLSKILQLPVNDTFMERFTKYAETVVSRGLNQHLWNIMVRLNPVKMEAPFRAQELMYEGLRFRLKRTNCM